MTVTLLLLCALLSLPPARAQDTRGAPSVDLGEEADLHFGAGITAYKAERWQEALEHLLLSNRLVPNRNVVFNVARTYEKLDKYEEAFRHYSEYVALEADPARRALGEQAIARIAPRLALVRITSDPPGALVYLDRKDLGARGRTPVSLALDERSHAVLLELEGHTPAAVTVEPKRGSTQTVGRDLPQILGQVKVDGLPEGATIRLDSADGRVLGTLPTVVELPPGPHVLVVSADGYRTGRQAVTVEADQTIPTAVELPLWTGSLVVSAPERDALVEIDGKAAGFTPAVLDVPAGDHVVRVTLRGYKPFERAVSIDADGSTTLDVELRSLREVTAASRSAQSVEDAPASVTLISAEEIRAFGYQSVYQALGGVRGVFQSNDLTYKYLGVRGFSRPGDYGNRVLVTVDGHTMNDDQLGASYVDSDFLSDLHDVQQIEVVRGPGSALYGSNAFFGVVNVVTRDAETMRGTHAIATADEERTARARVGTSFGDGDVGGWLSAGTAVSQGRDYVFDAFATLPRGNGGVAEGSDEYGAATFHGKAWLGDLTVQAFAHGRQKQFPTGAFDTRLADPRNTSNDYRGFAELRYEPEIGDKTRLYARAWLDAYQFRGDFPYGVSYIYEDTWRGAWAGVEPRVVTEITKALSLTAGAEARNHFHARLKSEELRNLQGDTYPGPPPLEEEPTFQVYSGYAIAEVGGDPVLLSVGGRVDRYQTPEAVEDDFTTANPRAALILKPNEDHIVKLMGGTAFRAPSVYEYLYNDGGISQAPADALAPERILTLEGEYTHRFTDVVGLTLSGYHNAIQNLVDTETVAGGPFRYANTGDVVRTVGFEYELRRDWQRGWMAVFQHAVQHTRVGDLTGDARPTNSPANLLAVKAAAPLVAGVSTVSTVIRAESPRLTEAGDQTPWAMIWDATVTGDLPGTAVSYGAGVRNLLDWSYTYPGGADLRIDQLPMPGRGLFATVSVEL